MCQARSEFISVLLSTCRGSWATPLPTTAFPPACKMTHDMTLMGVWAVKSTLFVYSPAWDLPCFCSWLIQSNHHAMLFYAWAQLLSSRCTPVLTFLLVELWSPISDCHWSICSLEDHLIVCTASPCPQVSSCPSAISLSYFPVVHLLCFTMTNDSLFQHVVTLFCHLVSHW